MSRRTIAAILLFLALPAVAQGSGNSVYLGDFSCWGSILPLKIDQNGVGLRKLGKLVAESPWKDSYKEYVFDGLVVTLYRPSYAQVSMVENVVVTKPGWNVVDGARVGDRIESIVKRLGKNAEVSPNLEVCGDGDCAKFQSTEGRITRIEYSCYTG